MSDVKIAPDKTWIPLGVAIGGIITIVIFALWVNNSFKDLSYQCRELTSSLGRVENAVKGISDQSVKRHELQLFIQVLKAKNPSLSVPDFQ